jgi:hypothetical protein
MELLLLPSQVRVYKRGKKKKKHKQHRGGKYYRVEFCPTPPSARLELPSSIYIDSKAVLSHQQLGGWAKRLYCIQQGDQSFY